MAYILDDVRAVWPILARVGARPRRLVGSVALSAIADVAGLGVAATLLVLVRQIVAGGSAGARFVVLACALYALILVKTGLEYGSQLVIAREASRATQRLRAELLARCFAAGKRFFDEQSTSVLRDTVISASAAPAAMIALCLAIAVKAISCAVVLAYLFHLAWQLALVAVAFAPLANLAIDVVVRRMRRAARDYAAARAALGRVGAEVLSGMLQVHAATAEASEAARFAAASDAEGEPALRRSRLEQLAAPAKEIGATSTLLVIAWAIGVLGSRLGVAELFVFIYLVQRLMQPLGAIGDARMKLAAAAVELPRVRAVLDLDPAFLVTSGERPFTRLARAIEIRGLAFAYPDRAPVLRALSAELRAGEWTGIVGASGCGKTTLLHLLFGFYDAPPGTLWIDGVELRELDQRAWRRAIAYVPQDVFVLDASLRDNACLGVERPVSDARVRDVLQRLGLGELLARLPAGLDSPLGERGCRASGGEKQRIALARAVLREAELVILDEVTNAVDETMASALVATLGELFAGKTVIMTTHRPALLAGADQILDLERGVVERRAAALRGAAP